MFTLSLSLHDEYDTLILALLSAAIFGNVSSIVLRIYQGTDEYHEKMQSIKVSFRLTLH